jgi:hypothetical protein
MTKISIIILVFIMVSVTWVSCFKEDERAVPYPGEIVTIPDSIQKVQFYFDLESGFIAERHPINIWQLGFESKSDGWHILTNSGDSWFMFNTEVTTEPVPGMPGKLKGLYDVPHAWPDSTAVGDWVTFENDVAHYTRNIYLLGKYTNGEFTDLRKIVFLEVSDTSYSFRYTNLSGGFTDTITISKEPGVNFVYFDFKKNKQVNLEPDKSDYDMVFVSYYDLATNFGITMPYLVGGGLINVWQTTATLDSVTGYAKITIETIPALDLRPQRDIPGYNWKTVTVDVSGGGAATYDVKTHYIYVIRSAQGNYFKLRFISYSFDARSGYPQFEYQLLE